MSHSVFGLGDISTLTYVITHVFFPLQLPNQNDYSVHNAHALARAVATTAHMYGDHVDRVNLPIWNSILRMLRNLQAITSTEILDMAQTITRLDGMNVGDVLALPIRAQNAGVIFRKQQEVTTYESFEIHPKAQDVMSAGGRLVCSYPGPAIEIPNIVFDDPNFRSELANFLVCMNQDDLDDDFGTSDVTSLEAQSAISRNNVFKDTVDPCYITELLTGILRSIGRPADGPRINKRVGDDIIFHENLDLPWRRSSLWLFIRILLQTTLDRSPLGHDTYKEFLLFFMCCLAEEKTCTDLPNDLLQFMLSKISHRTRKLGSSVPDWLSHTVSQTCCSLRSILNNRWKKVQAARPSSSLRIPSQLDIARDIQLSLSNSREYIHNSLAHHSVSPLVNPFCPKHSQRGGLDDFLSFNGIFQKVYRTEPYVALYDVERAVERGIDAWVDGVTRNNEACEKLMILAEEYSSNALETYGNNPELLSVMLVTVIELWVALDKIAIRDIPMLADYSPEIPTNLLECLLLSKTADFQRLRDTYEYLSRRHSRARNQWSTFSSTTTADSFAVRFYKKSPHLRHLKTRIEEVARSKGRRRPRTEGSGPINYLKRGITAITSGQRTGVYDWPLPADELQAELVVFELDCPVSFNMWRTATLHLLVDLCSPFKFVQHNDRPQIKLKNCRDFVPFLVGHPRSRVTLGSNTRASLSGHNTVLRFKDAPSFFAFDTRTGIPLSEALDHIDSKRCCTYKLQGGPYQNLQKYLDSTSHTSNEVIANQAECNEDLSIHEYMAFGHLRSGGLLQWLNILRELRGRSLSFRSPEVHMLLVQAASQVGPLENNEWMWHQEIQQSDFCTALLRELEALIHDVEANWMQGVTMDTVSFLLRRLLVSNPNNAISSDALDLLHILRSKVFSWVRELSNALGKASSGDDGTRDMLRNSAAICRSTFDIHDPVMVRNLLHSAEDVEMLLFSVMIVQEHTPSDMSHLSTYSQLLLDRDRRLSLALEKVLGDIIQADSSGVSLAVGRIWPGYRLSPGSDWTPWQGPNSRWFWCTTARPTDLPVYPQVVDLNILDGSLLVDGGQLGPWLRDNFTQHPLYKLIFGDQMLDVFPSNFPGMDYTTRSLIFDHQVYFALRNKGSDLVIRAKKVGAANHDLGMIELVSPERLKGDLPTVLIEGYVHWLDLSTSIIEIRPFDRIWECSSENWRINCTPGHYYMWKGHEYLVDIRSQSWKTISTLLQPLCAPHDLIVSASPTDPGQPSSSLQLSIQLPRYDLSFYLDEDGDLQSRNVRGMVYDVNQCIGTLFGLVNRLVLRAKVKYGNAPELVPRCVLIPDGKVSYCKDGHHVSVTIILHRSVLERVTYQIYTVNSELGCLMGNTTTSKLYCAYLHALTSGCGDDPLTGRSGVEEALAVLRSAIFWSNVGFLPRDAELLGRIASICPSHNIIFPGHDWSMQEVDWHNLRPTRVHALYELYFLAVSIKERCERLQNTSSDLSFQEFPLQDDHLLQRNARRAAHLSPIRISGQLTKSINSDVRHSARDVIAAGSGEHRAYIAATCVYYRNAASTEDIWKVVESWTGKMSRDASLSLRYDSSWLDPDLPTTWLTTYNLLRKSNQSKWFQLLFSLPAMAYASPDLSNLVPVFVAFASHWQFCHEDPPHYDSYPIWKGWHLSYETLHRYVIDCTRPFHSFDTPERLELAESGESPDALRRRQRQMYEDRQNSDADTTVQMLLRAWPCESPPPCPLNPALYNVAELESNVRRHFFDRFRNLMFKEHMARLQTILNELLPAPLTSETSSYSFNPSQCIPFHIPWRLTVQKLFSRRAPWLQAPDRLSPYAVDVGNTSLSDSAPLYQLLATIDAGAVNLFQQQYVSALRTSADSFKSKMFLNDYRATKIPNADILLEHYVRCRASHIEALSCLQRYLGPQKRNEEIVQQAGQWPSFTVHTLFRLLASNSPTSLPEHWKKCLTKFALITLELQRARRMILLHCDKLHEELRRELQNEGCDGWDAETHPDWLLIQLQGNFLIRRIQAEVADEMISPRSGSNTTMQLHMGEGKSSVIVPIVAAVLANGDQLVRVIVPKSLTMQTLNILMDRLGGLPNRRIYHLPFSRSTELDEQRVALLREIMSECMQERGILVLQPEHILSLKLVSVEKQLFQQESSLGPHLLLELQLWLHAHARDVLDESDEILDVRSQLIFTIGQQQHVDGSPERWTTVQQVLGLVCKHASSLHELFPLCIEYEPGPHGSFPYLRILQRNAGEKLVSCIIQDVVDGCLSNVTFGHLHFHTGLEDAIRGFIGREDISPAKVQLLKEYFGKTPSWDGLLLLRGLLATGILLFAFRERRWQVDYGLAPTRTMLAVPYRAKDVPSQRSEFGQPDVAIILTCLSYYYAGLSEDQLRLSFRILSTQHDPHLDYELWLRVCPAMPEALRTLSGVNIGSVSQWDQILYPLFSRNRATIDFYLSNVVFPKEAKEFPSKLSSSGWDLAEKKGRLVTGFSGTNDGKYLFPLHITQGDHDHQRGTNAMVLAYLLQRENNHYMCTTHRDGRRRTTHEFLQILVSQKPEIRVLLDVGAQILDLRNHELAKAWLNVTPNASASVYFNEVDELMVYTRDGSTQHLLSSPYARRIDRCVVYLDDAHTRGTDIKFPNGFRAAVTLGPKVTKDRLVQGCMRMRKLGHGHSVMFFAPLEVDQRVRAVVGKLKSSSKIIDTTDILHWAIQETWKDIQQQAPHWVQQGMEHMARYSAWSSFCRDQLSSEELLGSWLQSESKRLEDLYGPRDSFPPATQTDPIHQRCLDLGILSHWTVCLDEEQERELVYEVRRERQVERRLPQTVPPARHSIHLDVVNFVKTGTISARMKFTQTSIQAQAFTPAFESLHATSAAADEAYIWSQSLMATADFERTVEVSGRMDDYLRPVHWFLSAKKGTGDVLVILSPYEVNHLLPDIRSSNKVHLHLYWPRTIKAVQPLDFTLYSIPTVPDAWIPPYSLMDQLNAFAGQLYLNDYKSYIRLCRFLGVYAKDLEGVEGIVMEPDGFILPKNRNRIQNARTEIAHTFASSPLVCLRALMNIRCKGMDYTSTHMGKLLHGHLLSEDDFDH